MTALNVCAPVMGAPKVTLRFGDGLGGLDMTQHIVIFKGKNCFGEKIELDQPRDRHTGGSGYELPGSPAMGFPQDTVPQRAGTMPVTSCQPGKLVRDSVPVVIMYDSQQAFWELVM